MTSRPVLNSDDKATFRAILEGAAVNPYLGVIANRFPWQSRMAIERLLDLAREQKLEISMISGRGPEGFYDPALAERLTACRDAGCAPIRILIWQKDTCGISPSLMSLAETGVIQLKISGTDKFAEIVPHFLLVGDRAFRQEAAHKPFGKETVFTETEPQLPARIDFHDQETGNALKAIFAELWGK